MINYDRREPSSVTMGLMIDCDAEGIEVVEKTMPFGDYGWVHDGLTVLVERKKNTDLLSSLANGRAAEQFRNLIELADIPILLIEGWIEGHGGNVNVGKWKYQSGWNYSALFNILLGWQMAGLMLAFSPNERETAKRIISLYKFTGNKEHQYLSRKKIISIKEDSPQITTLATFPGIGHKRARELMKLYTLEELILHPDLEKVVGKVTAQKVRSHLAAK